MRETSLRRWSVRLAALLLFAVSMIPPVPRGIGASEIFYVAVFGAFVLVTAADLVSRADWGLPRTPILFPLFVLGILAVATVPLSLIYGVGIAAWIREMVPYVHFIVLPLLLVEVEDRRDVKVLLIGAIAATLSYSLQILQHLPQAAASFALGNPVALRAALSDNAFQPVPIAMMAFAMGVLSSRNVPRRGWWTVFFGIALVSVLLTLSRGPIVILAVLIMAVLLRLARRGQDFLTLVHGLVAAGVVTALALAGLALSGRAVGFLDVGFTYFANRFTDLPSEILRSGRYLEWVTIIDAIRYQPWLGKGFGFDTAFYHPQLATVVSYSYTHNVVSYVLLHLGVIGVAVLLWLGVAVVREMVVAGRRVDQERRWLWSGVCFGLSASVLYIQIQSVFRHMSLVLFVSFFLVALVWLRRTGGATGTGASGVVSRGGADLMNEEHDT